MSLATDGESVEVELLEGLLHEPALVLGGQRLARELLRGLDGEIGDLAPDLGDGPARLRLDVALGLLERLLALGLGFLACPALNRVGRLVRALEDLLRLLAGLLEALAVLVEQLLGFLASALGGVDRTEIRCWNCFSGRL